MKSIEAEKKSGRTRKTLQDKTGEDSRRNTKLGRRRQIEDLNEQKMLAAEMNDFEYC